MIAILDQEAIKIAHIAAKSDAKPILQCVRIGGGEIVACDGFVLAKRPIPTKSETGAVILVKARDILMAQKEWKAKSLVIDSSNISHVVIRDEASGNTIETQLALGMYPHTTKLCPTTKRKAYIVLDKYLLAKVLRVVSGRFVKLKIRESTEPIEFIVDETRGLIMPAFIKEED